MDQNVPSVSTYIHTSTNALVSNAPASQSGSSISTVGFNSNDIFQIGEVVTFGTVFAINPQNRQSTGSLKNFVITATTQPSASSTATLSISPALVTSPPYQNVTDGTVSTASVKVSILTRTATTASNFST